MPLDRDDVVHELADALPVRVFACSEVPPNDGVRVHLADGDRRLVDLDLERDDTELRVKADLFGGYLGCDAERAAEVIVVVVSRLTSPTTELVVLDTMEPIVREQARRLGFRGSLRGTLERAPWSLVPIEPVGPVPLAERLGRLLPDLALTHRTKRPLAQLARRARTGVNDIAGIDVRAGEKDAPLALEVTERPDLLTDHVAGAIDTVIELRRVIGKMAAHIQILSFTEAEQGFRSSRVAGLAMPNLSRIHLNGAYTNAEGLTNLRRTNADRSARRPPASVPRRQTVLDGIVAHECGHLIHHVFNLRNGAGAIELKRRLGQYFGVATLEHALRGHERGAPPDERLAYERLVTEVSAYATTNMLEAMAELYKIWWCTRSDPPPIAELFDRLVHELVCVTTS